MTRAAPALRAKHSISRKLLAGAAVAMLAFTAAAPRVFAHEGRLLPDPPEITTEPSGLCGLGGTFGILAAAAGIIMIDRGRFLPRCRG